MKKTNPSLTLPKGKGTVHSGFTLIELLVVVAIIALLAATILASLGAARTKARDARTTSELSSMRAQAELYNNSHKFTYMGSTSNVNTDCTADLVSSTSDTDSLYKLYSDVSTNATATYCNVSATNWVISATLQGGSSFCVDSNGVAESKTTAMTTGTNCP